MRYAAVLITAVMIVLCQPAGVAAQAADRPMFQSPYGWFAKDKPRHFGASGALAVTFYAAADAAGAGERAAVLTAVAASTAIGAAKEWHDWRSGRFIDPQDLVWNAAGVAAGTALASLVRTRVAARRSSLPAPLPAPSHAGAGSEP